MILENVLRTAQIRTDLLTINGPELLLAYTDDIDLVGNTVIIVNEIYEIAERDAKKTGLLVNEQKTKYL